ncbi:MAG: polysaccharide deacetylase family protein [Bacteroidota bacterium]
MALHFVKPPIWTRALYPGVVWNSTTNNKEVFLTFDDGPCPVVTPYVLDCLKRFNAKATFFMVGENVAANPLLYERVISEGHAVGNHTFSHLDGWKSPSGRYMENMDMCSLYVQSNLFRPPYGRLRPRQLSKARERYKVIMWDVMSHDYDYRVSPEKCVSNVLNHVKPGSIVVFHDSKKASKNISNALPLCMEALAKDGYTFGRIE